MHQIEAKCINIKTAPSWARCCPDEVPGHSANIRVYNIYSY